MKFLHLKVSLSLFKVKFLHLRESYSSLVSSNMKSSGNLSMLARTALLRFLVSTWYIPARSESNITLRPRISYIFRLIGSNESINTYFLQNYNKKTENGYLYGQLTLFLRIIVTQRTTEIGSVHFSATCRRASLRHLRRVQCMSHYPTILWSLVLALLYNVAELSRTQRDRPSCFSKMCCPTLFHLKSIKNTHCERICFM